MVRVWDADPGKLLATLLQPPSAITPATDWLIAVPGGFVAASESLDPLLRWQVAGKEVDRETMLPLFRNPEEVARALQ